MAPRHANSVARPTVTVRGESLARTRDLVESHLDAVPRRSVSELVGTLHDGHPEVVAVVREQVVGAALAQRAGDRAWIQRVAIGVEWRNRGIAT